METTREHAAADLPADAGQPAAEAQEERFKNRAHAFRWLQEQGYKVARGKFYQDCAAGVVLVGRDGSLSRYRVLEYGTNLRTPPPAPDVSGQDLALEKLRWEVRRIKNDVLKQDLALRAEDHRWVEQVDHERRVSLLVVRLAELYDYHSHLAAPELCVLAGGDQAASGQVVDRMKRVLDAVYQDLRGAVIGEVYFGAAATETDDQGEDHDGV